MEKASLLSQVQGLDLKHVVTDRQTKRYTITVVCCVQQTKHHSGNAKAVVEVYDSATNAWNTSNGVFHFAGINLVYYKKYVEDDLVGIIAYDKTTGYSSVPLHAPHDIVFSKGRGFFPVVEYQGQIYELRTEAATSGVWMLRGLSQSWEKLYSAPEPEVLKFYLLLLFVSAGVILIFDHKRGFHYDVDTLLVADTEELGNCYIWMLDRAQGKWIDVPDNELFYHICSQIIFEMRLGAIP